MPSALWAEWIIARLTDRSRAASIVGDLLETAAHRGPLWFWLSVARIVLSLTWRPAVAYLAAAFVGVIMVREFRTGVSVIRVVVTVPGPIYDIRQVHVHTVPGFWQLPFTLDRFGTLLWIAGSYAAIRYGLRDKFAQVALGFCCLYTVAFFYWRVPIVAIVCSPLALCILIVSVRSAQRGRALAALALALVLGFIGTWLFMKLGITAVEHFYSSMIYYADIFLSLLAVWTVTAACAWMHHLLLRRDQRSMEIESPGRVA